MRSTTPANSQTAFRRLLASTASSPPRSLRCYPAGTPLPGQHLHLLERRTFARHTWSPTPHDLFLVRTYVYRGHQAGFLVQIYVGDLGIGQKQAHPDRISAGVEARGSR